MAQDQLGAYRISLVIPAFNEARRLPALLESVEIARSRYAGGADQVETIVADNASTDATAEIARSFDCQVVSVEGRPIARVRNAGANAASGETLAFVDADSRIHPETFNAIDTTLSRGVIVGATGFRMSRSSPGIAASMLVTRAILLAGGADSGVIFCRRTDWLAVGGYNTERRYAEDVQLFRDLKRLGRSRRQRFARARGVRTITSARKFDRYGDWHLFTTLVRGVGWFVFNRGAWKRFTDDYWYGRR